MPLVTESLPNEAIAVRVTGTFEGEKIAYYHSLLVLWFEPIEGADTILTGVLAWEYIN